MSREINSLVKFLFFFKYQIAVFTHNCFNFQSNVNSLNAEYIFVFNNYKRWLELIFLTN